MNFKQTMNFIAFNRQSVLGVETQLGCVKSAKKVPCLVGPAGIGKTELVKEFCRDNNLACIVLHVSYLESSDLVGLFKVNRWGKTDNCAPSWLPFMTQKEFETQKGEMTAVEVEGLTNSNGVINPNGGIVFLDEVNRGKDDITQCLYQLLNERKMHTFKLPSNYTIVAAMNPPGGEYTVSEFDPALMDRLAMVEFEPSVDEALDYLEESYGKEDLMWARDHKEYFDSKNKDYVSVRTLEEMLIMLAQFKQGSYDQVFRNECLRTILPDNLVSDYATYFTDQVQALQVDEILKPEAKVKKGESWMDKIDALVKAQNNPALTVTTDRLADFFGKYEFSTTRTEEETQMVANLFEYFKRVPSTQAMIFKNNCHTHWWVDEKTKKVYYSPKNQSGLKMIRNMNSLWTQVELQKAKETKEEGTLAGIFAKVKEIGKSVQ